MPSLVVAMLAGCVGGQQSGALVAESLGSDPVALAGQYTTAVFARQPGIETPIYLSDVPAQQLLDGQIGQGVIVHLDLLWLPLPGSTPMDSSATNVTVRYVVIADGEVGVYGGAGFALPVGDAHGDSLSLQLRDASLTLLDATDGFVDLLSPARLTGRVTAARNDRRTREIGFAASQIVTNALGYTRLVDAGRANDRVNPATWSPQSSWSSSSWSSSSSSSSPPSLRAQ